MNEGPLSHRELALRYQLLHKKLPHAKGEAEFRSLLEQIDQVRRAAQLLAPPCPWTTRQLPEGITLDGKGHRLWILGKEMMVGSAMYSPITYSPRHGWLPESVHFCLLTGENGWWVELSIWPGEGLMTAALVNEPHLDRHHTAEEVLKIWVEACRKTEPPDLDPLDSPFSGLQPGTWLDFEEWKEL